MSVYVITDGKYFKIGYTDGAVETRIDTLQTGNPNRLILVYQMAGSRALEKELHGIYAAKRLSGEWFDLTNKDLKEIRELFCVSCGSRVGVSDVPKGGALGQKPAQPPAVPEGDCGKDVASAMRAVWMRLRTTPFICFSARYPGCDINNKDAVIDRLSNDPAHVGIKIISIDRSALFPLATPDRPWIADLLAWLAIDAQVKHYEKVLARPAPASSDPDNLTF